MKKIINFDFFNLLYVFILLIVGAIYFNGHISSIYSDIGREFYIPWQMNSGEVLYKDIFNVYSPLGYQLNSVVLKLFSNNINSLVYTAFIASFLALSLVYFIMKFYTNRIYAFVLTVFILFSCCLYQSISNWFYPYSYSVLYAMTAFLLSFLMLILYLKNDNIKYFFAACLFIGISVDFKYEYSLLILILIAIACYKKIGVKNSVKSIFLFVLIPFISILFLFIQGCRIEDFCRAFKYMFKLSNSESLKYFYSFCGFSFNPLKIKSVYSYIFYIALITLFIKKDKYMNILNFTTVFVNLKCMGTVSLQIYGTFFLPVLIIYFSVFIYKYVPKIRSYYLLIIICFMPVYINFDISSIINNKPNIINNNLYTDDLYFSRRYNELINYIKDNTKQSDKILVLPEGAMLNFLTERKSDNQLYYLIPPNVEIFGSENIIKRLKEKPPKYIIVFYNSYYWYNTTSFSNSYGKEIQKYINAHYDIEENISSTYDKMYKLKEK